MGTNDERRGAGLLMLPSPLLPITYTKARPRRRGRTSVVLDVLRRRPRSRD